MLQLICIININQVICDNWYSTATFVHMVVKMIRATSKGNEAQSKMKQPSDMPTLKFNHVYYLIFSGVIHLLLTEI